MKPQIFNLLTSISLFLLGSLGHWYILYWQPFTMKTAVQLLLAFTIIVISLFWK